MGSFVVVVAAVEHHSDRTVRKGEIVVGVTVQSDSGRGSEVLPTAGCTDCLEHWCSVLDAAEVAGIAA